MRERERKEIGTGEDMSWCWGYDDGVCCVVRLSEQSKLTAEQKRLKADIQEKLQEYKDWNSKYNVRTSFPSTGFLSLCFCCPFE